MFEQVTIKDVKLEIGQLIKSTRKKHGLNQNEFASQLNISRITVSNLELGKNTTLDTLLKAFLYFDLLNSFHEYFQELIRANQQKSLY
ncbi:helix-turn-helix transcriptional regulator [Pedobacter sp. MC2016-24]|nr:helix-turn-helix transcriptional regulator [Pedobacter sp. MC2016-24]